MSNYNEALEEVINVITFTTNEYHREYVFYLYLLSQCTIKYDPNLPSIAGVLYTNNKYCLILNPSEIVEIKGTTHKIPGFNIKTPIQYRIGIIKHEMLHILFSHQLRLNDRDPKLFNYATDCALNQEINRKHLPKGAIYPDVLFKGKHNIPENETSELYYDLMIKEMTERPKSELSKTFQKIADEGLSDDSFLIDEHDFTETSKETTEFKKEITKQMLEKAIDETNKLKGISPSFCADLIENLSAKGEVDWKKELRFIVANKPSNKRKTIIKPNRRTPNLKHIKGIKKDRILDIAVISDVSGSVSDNELVKLWNEILNICNIYNNNVNLVMIDTKPSDPIKLTKSTKVIERKGSGGTTLNPAISKLKEHNISFQALVVTTDGYTTKDDILEFHYLNKPVIWLVSKEGQLLDEMKLGKMKAVKLNN